MTECNEQQKEEWVEWEYRSMVKDKKGHTILWWVLVVMTVLVFLSAITSVIMYFVGDDIADLETTVNQLLMSVLALLCFFIPVFFKRKLKFYIPSYLLIIIYLFIYAHFVMGEIHRAYDSSLLFDKVLHTTGGVVIACIGISVVYALANMDNNKVRLSPFFVVLFSFCFALAIEYVWELFEYSVDRLINANMQRWKDGIIAYDEAGNAITSVPWGSGLKDTMGDMAVNILGALCVCIISFIVLIKKPQWMEGKLIASDKRLRAVALERVEAKIAAGEPVPDFKAMFEEEMQRREARRKRGRKGKDGADADGADEGCTEGGAEGSGTDDVDGGRE